MSPSKVSYSHLTSDSAAAVYQTKNRALVELLKAAAFRITMPSSKPPTRPKPDDKCIVRANVRLQSCLLVPPIDVPPLDSNATHEIPHMRSTRHLACSPPNRLLCQLVPFKTESSNRKTKEFQGISFGLVGESGIAGGIGSKLQK